MGGACTICGKIRNTRDSSWKISYMEGYY